MAVETTWTQVPVPSGGDLLGWGLDPFGNHPFGAPSTGTTISTSWTEVDDG